VQEIAVSRKATVYCGPHTLDWEQFGSLGYSISKRRVSSLMHQQRGLTQLQRDILQYLVTDSQKALQLAAMQLMCRDNTPAELSFLLFATKNCYASEPKNKIYALLGLTNPPSPLRPDYRENVKKVYTNAFTQTLREGYDLEGLSIVPNYKKYSTKDLPSWVPDFETFTSEWLPFANSEGNTRLYSSSGSDYENNKKHLRFESDGQVLVLRGIVFDTIEKLGEVSPRQLKGSLNEVLQDWKSLAGIRNGEYQFGDSKFESFWRTILVDREPIDFKDPDPRSEQEVRRLDSDAIALYLPANSDEEEELIAGLDSSWGPQTNKRFLITRHGFMGLAHEQTCRGDTVCVLLGGQVPYLLRPLDGGYYCFIGEW
jgi:hypothetical protein